MSVNADLLKQIIQRAPTMGHLDPGANLCIIDTNIALDLLLFHDKKSQFLFDLLKRDELIAVGHFDTFYEFADVICRAQFILDPETINELLNEWVSLHTIVTETLPTNHYCKDTDDDKFFNLACVTGAKYLLSKDKKVLKAKGKAKRFNCLVLKPENLPI